MPGDAVAAIPASRKLGHYRILEKIGSGGHGGRSVPRARRATRPRSGGWKVFYPRAFWPMRPRASASATRRWRSPKFNHPNIATIYDFDADAGADFIVTELVSGETLAEKIAAGRLPEREILDWRRSLRKDWPRPMSAASSTATSSWSTWG